MKLSGALVALFLAGCASTSPEGSEDFLAVAKAALPQIERGQTDVKLVVGPSTDTRARSAMAKLRTVIELSEVPKRAGFSLPEGYVVIERFELSKDEAVVKGHAGPVLTGNLLSCGYYITVPLKRVAGRWIAEQAPVAVC